MLPSIAQGDSNKLWIIPSEIGKAMEGLGSAVGQIAGIPQKAEGNWQAPEISDAAAAPEVEGGVQDKAVAEADNAVQEAIAAAQNAAVSGRTAPAPAPSTSPEHSLPEAEPPLER
jgi:hypothetical protein